MPGQHVVRSLLKGLGWAVANACFTIRVEGREHIPEGGPLIVICNHFHWSEPLLMGLQLPWEVEYIGAASTMRHKGVGWLLRMYKGIPVERGSLNGDAMREALRVLAQGRILGIFPEGRTHRRELSESYPGMAFLAERSGAPVLPAAVEGTDIAEGAWKKLRRLPAIVRFGPVFKPEFSPLNGGRSRERLQQASDEMMRRIADLLPPRNRGRYTV